ncbi:MAG: DUF362 domain-containing protein [Nitrospirota bacterium]
MSSVSIVRCQEYDRDLTMSAVRKAVESLGGMQAFIRPGERVLIKPNLLKANRPEQAVTTHPEVVRSVIRLVQETGGIALVGDSPGFGNLETVCERSGILDVIRDEGVSLVSFDEAVALKNNGQFHRFEVAKVATEVDAIINLPKFKTHGMTVLTGAVKNMFGCVPGKRKVQWHFNAGVNHNLFMRMILELYMLLKPRLSIMDAIVGMEGNGPGSGKPRSIGLVLASEDAVALDAVCGRIAGIMPEKLPLLKAASEAGIGETQVERIRVLGEQLSNLVLKQFRLPGYTPTEWPLPEWLRRALKHAFTTKPVIRHELCSQCGICKSHCPQHAFMQEDGRLTIRYRDCIRCFCCQELCPQGAIAVGKGWAIRMAR